MLVVKDINAARSVAKASREVEVSLLNMSALSFQPVALPLFRQRRRREVGSIPLHAAAWTVQVLMAREKRAGCRFIRRRCG
jgi:hypothetical protein